MLCPHGHTYTDAEAQFCPHCGVSLGESSSLQTTVRLLSVSLEERLIRLERILWDDRIARLEKTVQASAVPAGADSARRPRVVRYILSTLMMVVLIGAGVLAWVGYGAIKDLIETKVRDVIQIETEVRDVVQSRMDSVLAEVQAIEGILQRNEDNQAQVLSPIRNRVLAARRGYLVGVEVVDAETRTPIGGAHVELNTIEASEDSKEPQDVVRLMDRPIYRSIHLEAKTDAQGRAYFALPKEEDKPVIFIGKSPFGEEYIVSATAKDFAVQSATLKYGKELRKIRILSFKTLLVPTVLSTYEIQDREPDEFVQLILYKQ